MFQALRCILQSIMGLSRRFSETKTAPKMEKPLVKTREETCAGVVGYCANRSKLTTWLKEFDERHLMLLEEKDVGAIHVQAPMEPTPQMSRLASWLTKFERS
ncbi:hypothetical protein V7S43_004977 [Phytophthora oleae]|uniref:Uncharacterized protein n=1 Tax=Phytophthora oleae TaxID=2107226 RepID=A0ABD3FUC1_9STRA